MAREDWKAEIRDAMRREDWSLTGAKRVVKVVPRSAPDESERGGYIMVAKSLFGKDPARIQTELGLPKLFAEGVKVYNFLRLPRPSEYTYELTLKFPDGQAYNPAMHDPNYLPGSDKIHQWQIKPGIKIPVDLSKIVELMPGQRFRAG